MEYYPHLVQPANNHSLRSKLVKMIAPFNGSNESSIRGNVWASFTVRAFNLRKSIQKRNSPVFFQTKTTALAHGLFDFRIVPISTISLRCFFTSSY